jgi:hypothetical protein
MKDAIVSHSFPLYIVAEKTKSGYYRYYTGRKDNNKELIWDLSVAAAKHYRELQYAIAAIRYHKMVDAYAYQLTVQVGAIPVGR